MQFVQSRRNVTDKHKANPPKHHCIRYNQEPSISEEVSRMRPSQMVDPTTLWNKTLLLYSWEGNTFYDHIAMVTPHDFYGLSIPIRLDVSIRVSNH